jgi:uncharacterized protein YjiS (DUF1127 family)
MEDDMHPNTVTRIHPEVVQGDKATGGRVRRWIGRWIDGAVMRWQRRRMIEALQRLDDRILRDIGVTRGEIRYVVEGFSRDELRMKPPTPPIAETQDDYKMAA